MCTETNMTYEIINHKNEEVHIIPLDEKNYHTLDSACNCNPELIKDTKRLPLIVHYSITNKIGIDMGVAEDEEAREKEKRELKEILNGDNGTNVSFVGRQND